MEKVTPQIKSVPFGRLVISAEQIKSESGLILDAASTNKKPVISDVQTVVAVGLNCKEESGIVVNVGDRVLLNTANPRLGHPIFFKKDTGELAKSTDPERDCDMYLVIEAREVILVL